MPGPLVVAGGLALRQGGLWLGKRVLVPVGRAIGSGLGRAANFLRSGMSLSRLANLSNLLTSADNAMPSHFEEVDVTVFGGPKATKRDLWRIAIAAAFGKIQRRDAIRVLPAPGFMQIEYPLEGNAVRVTLRQETPYLSLFTGRLRKAREFELYSGPPDDLKGGAWAFTSSLPGVGANLGPGADYPKTGYEDRTLLTPSPTYVDRTGAVKASSSPHPSKDKLSRSTAPVAESTLNRTLDPNNWNNDPTYLLYAALNYPCEPVMLPVPTGQPPVSPPLITDLTTGEPFPLPTQNPSGSPSTEPSTFPPYIPPQPAETPPDQASQNPSVGTPPVDISVPIAQIAYGSLNGIFNQAESNITGISSGNTSSLSGYFLGLGGDSDYTRTDSLNTAVINFAAGIANTRQPVVPVLPPVTPPIGGGGSY